MSGIMCWAERPPGPDPTVHFWTEHPDGERYRLCDGDAWPNLLTVEPARSTASEDEEPYVPCSACQETYLADVLNGRKLLNILPFPPSQDTGSYTIKNAGYAIQNRVYPPNHMVSLSSTGGQNMPRIPLSLFANFYEARPAAQVSIVRDIRTRMLNPKEYRRRDYYMGLRNFLEKSHWLPRSIDPFKNGLNYFLADEKGDKRDLFRKLAGQYMSFWDDARGDYFYVPPVDVEMGELVVMVRPEVGLLSHGDRMALKIWFNMKAPTRQTRQLVHHFMERARDESDQWSNGWNVGLLDIPRKRIPPPVRPAKDFQLGLTGQVAAFLQIWKSLEDEARMSEEHGPLS